METDLRHQLAEAQARLARANGCFKAAADEGLFARIEEAAPTISTIGGRQRRVSVSAAALIALANVVAESYEANRERTTPQRDKPLSADHLRLQIWAPPQRDKQANKQYGPARKGTGGKPRRW